MSLGASLLASAKAQIQNSGQLLTVRRVDTGATRQRYLLPQDIDPDGSSYRAEGAENVHVQDRTRFVAAGDTDIVAVKDEISFDGWWHRVAAVHGTPLNGVFPTRQLDCFRTKAVT